MTDSRNEPAPTSGTVGGAQVMLMLGACLNFLIAAGHLAALLFLDAAFRYYGIDDIMHTVARHGAALPYLITVALSCAFAVCGLYALSAARRIRPLPLLWPAVYAIAAAYLLRALWGLLVMAAHGAWHFRGLSALVLAALVGTLYLLGAIYFRRL